LLRGNREWMNDVWLRLPSYLEVLTAWTAMVLPWMVPMMHHPKSTLKGSDA
jgi:hypothetical protein